MSEDVPPPTEEAGNPLKLVHSAPGEGKKKRKSKSLDDATKDEFRAILAGTFSQWPPLKRNFRVVLDDRGSMGFVEVLDGGICKYVSREAVVNTLMAYSLTDLRPLDPAAALALPPRIAEELVRQWATCQESFDLDLVAPVRTKSEAGLCWQRLDFDLTPGDTPTFDELFQAAGDMKAVRQWVGSLFDPNSPRQQYVYLWGTGGDGKGSFLDFLSRVFGPTYKSEQPPNQGDKFWTQGLLGKRVVAFDDYRHRTFLSSALFMGLTGGSRLRVEEKNGPTFDGVFIAKPIITSNYRPNFEGDRADKRRIIYREFQKRDVVYNEAFKDRLWSEAAAFLWKCRAEYAEIPTGLWIPDDPSRIEAVLERNHEDNHHILEKYFELDPDATIRPSEIAAVLRSREGANLSVLELKAFNRFLETRHGLVSQRPPLLKNDGGHRRPRCITGLRFNRATLAAYAALIERESMPGGGSAAESINPGF